MGQSAMVECLVQAGDACALDDEKKMQGLLDDIVSLLDVTVVGRVSHKFQPQGVTILLLLAESHISVHTWPERGSFTIDVHTCSRTIDKPVLEDIIARHLDTQSLKVRVIDRTI